tara:strand:+ start:1181 stop:1747 length:567 start_codon:yes stop_codon:yes gene_type:complete
VPKRLKAGGKMEKIFVIILALSLFSISSFAKKKKKESRKPSNFSSCKVTKHSNGESLESTTVEGNGITYLYNSNSELKVLEVPASGEDYEKSYRVEYTSWWDPQNKNNFFKLALQCDRLSNCSAYRQSSMSGENFKNDLAVKPSGYGAALYYGGRDVLTAAYSDGGFYVDFLMKKSPTTTEGAKIECY